MLILGIDPGTAVTGFGIVRCWQKKIRLIDHGSIRTSKDKTSPQRLDLIYRGTMGLLREHRPKIMAIESLFFNTNAKSATAVGQAMGVVKLAAARKKTKVIDYPPLKIKMSLTTNGRATKKEIQKEVQKILGLKEIPRPNHAADALAVAICHWRERIKVKAETSS
jgi:crossover junction endodeoxyribonuclease RuvC